MYSFLSYRTLKFDVKSAWSSRSGATVFQRYLLLLMLLQCTVYIYANSTSLVLSTTNGKGVTRSTLLLQGRILFSLRKALDHFLTFRTHTCCLFDVGSLNLPVLEKSMAEKRSHPCDMCQLNALKVHSPIHYRWQVHIPHEQSYNVPGTTVLLGAVVFG